MKTIDKLIFDTLAERRNVALPGVGVLAVKRVGAKKISETELAPPYNHVAFSPDEIPGAVNIVSLLEANLTGGAGNTDGANLTGGAGRTGEEDVAPQTPEDARNEAAALYTAWLEGARREDGGVEITGVGQIDNAGNFTPSQELETALNPIKQEIMTMETQKKSVPTWIWIVVAAAVVLLALALFHFFGGDLGIGRNGKKPAVETVITSPVHSTTADDGASGAGEEGDATGASSATAPKTPGTATSGPLFHIIAGSFSVEKNADNFIAQIKRQHPELSPQKLPHPTNGLHMVSILSESNRRDASNKMNLYRDIDLDLWIFEQK